MDIYFNVTTPLGHAIRTTESYWQYVVTIKHPTMVNKEEIVRKTLKNPDKIYRSKLDNSVFLYYCKFERLYCVVAKHISLSEGFLVTCYPTDKVKEGELIWTR